MLNDNRFIIIKEELNKISKELWNITAEDIFKERIDTAQKRLNIEKMNVLVVGEFSRGKSTFINAIVGKQVLPSSVNPTTATINILEGNNLNNMTIYYRNKENETVDLPNEKLKDFLDSYVTVQNEEALEIEKIELNISGNLEEWNCVLVDTPGVSDLDEAREEVTFKYLSEADACIVLLDSQQPLSESERRFIKDKILTNDINRLLFVINRVDDIDDVPNGKNFIRIREYVIEMLKKTLPELKEPIVFGVSARETLKARHKNLESSWEKDFSKFENEAIKFVSNNAIAGKIPQHISRLKNICKDMHVYLSAELSKLNCSNEELEYLFEKLNNEAKILKLNMKDIALIIENQKNELAKEINKLSKKEFGDLKVKLVNEANGVNNEDKFNILKTHMSQGMRNTTEKLSKVIYEHREKLQDLFYANMNKILKENSMDTSIMSISNKEISLDVKNVEQNLSYFINNNNSNSGEISDEDAASFAIGGVCGLIGAALFGGPVGIIAAVIGAGFVSGMFEDSKAEEEAKQKTKNMILNIISQINSIVANAEKKASEIAACEINEIASDYKEMLNNRINMIEKSVSNRENDLQNRKNNFESTKTEIEGKIEYCKSISLQLEEFEGEI